MAFKTKTATVVLSPALTYAAMQENDARAAKLKRYAEVMGGTKLERAFAKVHIEGGPCVQSAPDDEEFVAYGEQHKVTCRECQVTLALLEGENPADGAEPSALAKKLVKVHKLQTPPGGWNECGEMTYESAYSSDWEDVTCPECLKARPR